MVRRRIWVLLLLCGVLGVLVWRQPQAVCQTPIAYRMGHIDAQFDLTDSEVRKAIEQATQLWENALGRTLFEYSATSPLTINFVFDVRQHATRLKQRLLSRLQQTAASHAGLA